MDWWNTIIGGALALAIVYAAFAIHGLHSKVDSLKSDIESLHAKLWKLQNPDE